MRATIERNDPRLVIHFHQNRDVSGTLHNTVVAVVRLRKHRWAGGSKENAAFSQKAIFRAVGRMLRLLRAKILRALLRGRSQRWNLAVRRVDDERCSPALDHTRAALKP